MNQITTGIWSVTLLAAFGVSRTFGCPTPPLLGDGTSSSCHCGAGCTCCTNHTAAASPADESASSASFGPDVTDVTIHIKDFVFTPQFVTIYEGTTVTWVNEDDAQHNTVSVYGLWESDLMNQGQSYSFEFGEGTDGQWDYFCTLHGGMIGTITVLIPEPGTLAFCALMPPLVLRRSRKRRIQPPVHLAAN